MELRGRVVVVTGASSGIGRDTARAFAARGATVVAVARREGMLQTLIEDCRRDSPESSYLAGDLGVRSFAEQVVAETVARHGRLDILVNNAAVPKHKHVFKLSADEAEEVLRINFLSALWTTLTTLPVMLRQGNGTIVNVSSFAAKVTPPREAIYAASKAAMNAFSEGLWHDLEGTGIHVAMVNPGPIDTEIWAKDDEPSGYGGPKYPTQVVVDAILDAVKRRVHEVTVPRRNPQLVTARLLRLVAPSVLRRGMARMEPVKAEDIAAARERAGSDASDDD